MCKGSEVETTVSKVFWVSRHDLSPAQLAATRDLHGKDVEVIKDPAVFDSAKGLADYIRAHPEGFVYAVAGAPHYIVAVLVHLRFGVFENHPQKRRDGNFGLAAVYHFIDNCLIKVWENPDPMSDKGELLIPIAFPES